MKNLIVGTLVVLSLAACNTSLQRPDYCVGKLSLIYDVAEKSHIDPAAVSQRGRTGSSQAKCPTLLR